jgi:hypothetical protein
MKNENPKNTKTCSKITALIYVSASELAKVIPDFTYDMLKGKALNDILYSLGMDTDSSIECQETIPHRNRFGESVICDRWVGNERTDSEWIASGYASREAIDKSLGNKLLDDLYRMRGMTGAY